MGHRKGRHSRVPDEVVSLQCYCSQDQLESVSMRFLVANDIPRLTWCDDRDSQEHVSDECQN